MGFDLYNAANVPERHKDFRPAQSATEQWSSLYEQIKAVLNKGVITAIVGKRGCGKTQLGACLIGHCCLNLDLSAMYTKSTDIFLRIRESMRFEGDSERMAIQEFTKPYLLVIDAFEVRSDSQFENRMLDHIIDKRYDATRSTIILSNDTVKSLQLILGESIVDRVRETGEIIEMTWQSFRLNKNKS